jgi:rubrerythrin
MTSAGGGNVRSMDEATTSGVCELPPESRRPPCDVCGHPMEPEHAHSKCPACGYILPCCGW